MEGPTKTFPRKPKSNLKQVIMTKKTKEYKKRSHEQLHAYLVENFVDTKKTINRDVFLEDITTEAQALEKLKDGFKHLKRQNAQTLFFFIQYGMLLNAVYKKFSNYVFKGLSLLHGVAGMQNRWEDTLNFMKLDFLSPRSFKKELVALFNSSPEMNTFWKQNPDICPTQEMESSQEVMTLPTL
ncbi:unnamed protein product [Mytilus coruscus]|uniref:Uncharacterized protein n=1 Tax=Mytilus coruscus TaxID=42192 RepID=A0A6J8AT31_MYTCO|nr:unnamed protein product [Mytilus coruscus]